MASDYRKQYMEYQKEQQRKKAKHSVCLFFAFLLGFIYLVFLLFITYVDSPLSAEISADLLALVGDIVSQFLVWPHMVLTLLAVIFTGFAFARKSRKMALAGAILYTVALVVYPGYFMFVILEALLAFIGFMRTP
ncbi:MAG: hypothetical protein LUC30_05065 [Clostridiales bacterium]|nr:hypothetical protein [Clostridiales bacterium]